MITQFGYGVRDFSRDGQGDKECGKRTGQKQKALLGIEIRIGLLHFPSDFPAVAAQPMEDTGVNYQPVVFLKGGITVLLPLVP